MNEKERKAAKERGYRSNADPTQPGTIHGTPATYKNLGCRCDKCRAAASDYERRRRHSHDPSPEFLAELERRKAARQANP